MFFDCFYFIKMIKNSAKLPKMTNKKPLLEHQKQRLEIAIEWLSTQILHFLLV